MRDSIKKTYIKILLAFAVTSVGLVFAFQDALANYIYYNADESRNVLQSRLDVNGVSAAGGTDSLAVFATGGNTAVYGQSATGYAGYFSGKVRIATQTTTEFEFFSSASSGYSTFFSMDDTGLKIGNNSPAGRDIEFQTGSPATTKLTILTGGNVGIGTASPSKLLEVQGADAIAELEGTTGDSRIEFLTTGDQRILIGLDKSDSSKFKITDNTDFGTNDRLTIDTGGNVGIGTATPSARLQVASAGDTATSYTARFQSSASVTGAGGILFDQNSVNAYKLYTIGTSGAGGSLSIDYITQATGAVLNGSIITLQNGRLGVGSTSPSQTFAVGSGATDRFTVAGATGDTAISGALTVNGNTTLGDTSSDTLTINGTPKSNGYTLATAGDDNLIVNGDFENGTSIGWTGSISVESTDTYAGNYAVSSASPNTTILSNDYIPVDPTYDVLELEGYIKKVAAGTTPGVTYFGYATYDSTKTLISSCGGTYCYYAASAYSLPFDGNWHKFAATTTGTGAFPKFPTGTRYVRVVALLNYKTPAPFSDDTTAVDHITVKRLHNAPIFVGNNFSTFNLVDQQQVSKLYTTTANSLILEPPSSGNVGIGTTTPDAAAKLDVAGQLKTSAFRLGTSASSGQVLTADTNGIGTWQNPASSGVQESGTPADNNVTYWNGGGTTITGTSLLQWDPTAHQLRLGADASNFLTATVSAAGTTTFDATGTTPGFTFSDSITASGGVTCTNCIDLTSETAGNYVAGVTEGVGINVTGTAGEGWSPTVTVDTADAIFSAWDKNASDDLTTSTALAGDVTGTYLTTVVGDDSHNHGDSTVSNNISIDSTSNLYALSGTLGVGIGTTTLGTEQLVVQGATNGRSIVKVNQAGNNDYEGFRIDRDGSEKWFIGSDGGASDNFIFRKAGADPNVVVIDTSGRVGIGDTTPASLLTVGSGDKFQVNSLGQVVSGLIPLTDKQNISTAITPLHNIWQFLDQNGAVAITVSPVALSLSSLFDGQGATLTAPVDTDFPITITVDYGAGTLPSLADTFARFVVSMYAGSQAQTYRVEAARDDFAGGAYQLLYETTTNSSPYLDSGPLNTYTLFGDQFPQRVRITLDNPAGAAGFKWITDVMAIKTNAELTGGRYVAVAGGNNRLYQPLSINPTTGNFQQSFGLAGTTEWDIIGDGSRIQITETGVGERFRIASGGNVGIGTASPESLGNLTVAGPEGASGGIAYWADEGDDDADKWLLFAGNDGKFYVRDKSSGSYDSNLVIDGSNGYVGIGGDTTPDALLSVGNTSQFRVDTNGDLVRIKNIAYLWPPDDGDANEVLTTNGSGTLTWELPAAGEAPLTFNNGLTRTSDTITLGGPLTTQSATITQGSFDSIFNLSGTGDFKVQNDGTDSFVVNDSGFTGIGGAPSTAFLTVTGNASFDPLRLVTTAAGEDTWRLGPGTGGAGSFGIFDDTAGGRKLAIANGATGGVNVTNNLNVGGSIGVGTAGVPSAAVDVAGNPALAYRDAYFAISGNNTDVTDRPYIRGLADHFVLAPASTRTPAIADANTMYLAYPGNLEAGDTVATRLQESLFITATGSAGGGNVGIGSPSPQAKLTIGPSGNIGVEVAPPTTIGIATFGGTLPAGTYSYVVTSVDGSGGETVRSNEVSITVNGTQSVTLNWSAVVGATQYRVFRTTTAGTYGASSLIKVITAPTVAYVDTGADTLQVGTPPAVTTAFVTKLASAGNSWFTGGNVGIGTANPQQRLQVGEITDGAANVARVATSTAASVVSLWREGGSATAGKEFALSSINDKFFLSVNPGGGGGVYGLPALRNSSIIAIEGATKFVGIGTGSTTPAALLSVGSSSQFRVDASGNLVRINNVQYSWPTAGSAGVLTSDATGTLGWTGGTDAQTLRFNGTTLQASSFLRNTGSKVSIGDVAPGAMLTVSGNAGFVGSADDTIYAYADSGNAAVSAKQANAGGYAGYFSGKVGVTDTLSVGSTATVQHLASQTGYFANDLTIDGSLNGTGASFIDAVSIGNRLSANTFGGNAFQLDGAPGLNGRMITGQFIMNCNVSSGGTCTDPDLDDLHEYSTTGPEFGNTPKIFLTAHAGSFSNQVLCSVVGASSTSFSLSCVKLGSGFLDATVYYMAFGPS